jgi:glycosyltransferase involved in cell wall biosynthesis
LIERHDSPLVVFAAAASTGGTEMKKGRAGQRRLSVVIPAHNEEAVIERCLRALLDEPGGELDVVVAANGCTDRTVAIASRFDGVRVLEIETASKHAALNAGDNAALHFPRAYVDADIVVSGRALQAVGTAMERTGTLAGAPARRLDLDGCPWYVHAFYRVWCSLAWSVDAPIGSGVYMLSEAGHDRVGRIPDIINDDDYVHSSFTSVERVCLREHSFVMRPPRTLRGLVLRRTRTIEGQLEMRERFGALPGAAVGPGPLELLRESPRPRRALDVLVFLTVTALARLALRRKRRRGLAGWERDDSSRRVAPEGI